MNTHLIWQPRQSPGNEWAMGSCLQGVSKKRALLITRFLPLKRRKYCLVPAYLSGMLQSLVNVCKCFELLQGVCSINRKY